MKIIQKIVDESLASFYFTSCQIDGIETSVTCIIKKIQTISYINGLHFVLREKHPILFGGFVQLFAFLSIHFYQ